MELYKNYFKRIIDFLGALLILVVLSPILIVLSLMVYLNLGYPIIYAQYRPGKNDKIFKMYKFRSMTNERNEFGDLLPDSQRLTKFGLLLRKSSLDELPELINILKGDMSFIGPRPLSVHYLSSYSDEERKRHEVRPGLSGLAQINGRNASPWPERLADDRYYVDHLSFGLDLKILFFTFYKVIRQSDVKVRGKSDMVSNFNMFKKLQNEGSVGVNPKKEIGSEFEYVEPSNKYAEKSVYDYLTTPPNFSDVQWTISGRNAIGLVIDDILETREVKSVYMPAYSCVSMIQPFLEREIEIKYYNVQFKENRMQFEIPHIQSVDIFFYMDYFGFQSNADPLEEALSYYRKQGIPIIEDNTQNLFSEKTREIEPDYSVVSLRKWFALASGGIAYKYKGSFAYQVEESSDEAVANKIKAMKMKKEYLQGGEIDKKVFLKKYGTFNNSVIRFDQKLTIDQYSLNYLKETLVSEIVKKRRLNAQFIYEKLNETKDLQFMFAQLKENEVPLFVPIKVNSDKRDALRKYLIDHQVYLPVHWPEKLSEKTNIPEFELSLICDQRYQPEDLKRMIDLINQWIEIGGKE